MALSFSAKVVSKCANVWHKERENLSAVPFSAKQNMDVSMSETICLISALCSIVRTAAYLLLPCRKDIGNLLL